MALFACILFLLGDKMNRKAEKNMLSEEKTNKQTNQKTT